MMKFWRFIFLITLFCSSANATGKGTPQFALQQSEPSTIVVEINPVVLLNAAAPTQKQNGGSFGWTGEVATGFGLLTSFSIFDSPFDLETGAIYMNETSTRDVSGISVTQKVHEIHIPLLLRFNFDEKIGLGFGGYADIAKGSISPGIHDRDFGLLFSARASLMIVPQLYFIIDGRYQHGLSNLANIPPGVAGDVYNTRSMQAYLGLSYRFMPF